MAGLYWIRVGHRFVAGYSTRHETVLLSAESALLFPSRRRARRFVREHLDRGRGLYSGHFVIETATIAAVASDAMTRPEPTAHDQDLPALIAYTARPDDHERWRRSN
jgi:hypothetical protein